MPIQPVNPPRQRREGKYTYTEEDVESALIMLEDMRENADADAPGDGPFLTEGEARSAGNAMVVQMGTDGRDVGVRVWVEGETKTEKREKKDKTKYTVETGAFYFALKNGRKHKKDTSENGTEPEAE